MIVSNTGIGLWPKSDFARVAPNHCGNFKACWVVGAERHGRCHGRTKGMGPADVGGLSGAGIRLRPRSSVRGEARPFLLRGDKV